MSPFVRFIYYLSSFVFVVFLFFSYYQMPENVAISHNSAIGLTQYMPKPDFFYWGAGVFMAFNFLIQFLKKATPLLAFSALPIPNKSFWLESTDAREGLLKVFDVWYNSFATIFNLFIGFLAMIVFMINNHAVGTFWTYRYFIWGGIGLLSSWWLVLVLRLLVKKHEL